MAFFLKTRLPALGCFPWLNEFADCILRSYSISEPRSLVMRGGGIIAICHPFTFTLSHDFGITPRLLFFSIRIQPYSSPITFHTHDAALFKIRKTMLYQLEFGYPVEKGQAMREWPITAIRALVGEASPSPFDRMVSHAAARFLQKCLKDRSFRIE